MANLSSHSAKKVAILKQGKDASSMCARVCRWQEHRLSQLPGGRVAPCLLSIRHNTPMAWGQAPLLAGVTDITLTANHHSSAVPPTPAEPALQICNPQYPPVPQYSTPEYSQVTPHSMQLSPGECLRNVLLRFLGTNSTTEHGIMAHRLKFSFGIL